MTNESRPHSLLFVCLGNICRSPLAEGIFLHLAEKRGVRDRFIVDSAGTGGWHTGSSPDPRAIEVAERFGIKLPSIARQITPEDLVQFEMLIAMDAANRAHLVDMGARNVRLMREFQKGATSTLEVPDPYYGEGDGFVKVYEMLVESCEGLIEHLTNEEI